MTDKRNSYKFLFDILFSSPTDTKRFMFAKNKVFLSSRYPFSISLKELTLLGEVVLNKCTFVTNRSLKMYLKQEQSRSILTYLFLATNGIKKIFESNLYLLKENTEIEAPPTIKQTVEGQMDKRNVNILKKQIDLKSLTHAFEHFFLYDLENMINKIYVTQ